MEFKCNECGREFSSKEALDMHNNSKHYKAPKVQFNNKKTRNWIIFILLIFIIVGGVYYFTNKEVEPGKYDEFAKCLTTNGAKMYGAFWCPHCQKEKEEFGKSWQYINYIECSNPDRSQTQICTAAGVNSYPTWEFLDKSRLEGFISLQELAKKTNCTINTV